MASVYCVTLLLYLRDERTYSKTTTDCILYCTLIADYGYSKRVLGYEHRYSKNFKHLVPMHIGQRAS